MEQGLTTSFDNICEILAEIWQKRDDIEYSDFVSFNLLGVTLAYAYSEELIEDISPDASEIIEESFDAFLDEHEVDDIGYEYLADIYKEIENDE